MPRYYLHRQSKPFTVHPFRLQHQIFRWSWATNQGFLSSYMTCFKWHQQKALMKQYLGCRMVDHSEFMTKKNSSKIFSLDSLGQNLIDRSKDNWISIISRAKGAILVSHNADTMFLWSRISLICTFCDKAIYNHQYLIRGQRGLCAFIKRTTTKEAGRKPKARPRIEAAMLSMPSTVIGQGAAQQLPAQFNSLVRANLLLSERGDPATKEEAVLHPHQRDRAISSSGGSSSNLEKGLGSALPSPSISPVSSSSSQTKSLESGFDGATAHPLPIASLRLDLLSKNKRQRNEIRWSQTRSSIIGYEWLSDHRSHLLRYAFQLVEQPFPYDDHTAHQVNVDSDIIATFLVDSNDFSFL